jgi:ubiquinone/menaquinone biosynthesis C-methylase UbiE
LAICFGLFPHLKHKNEALCQLNRVLKVNGKLVIAHALSSAEIKMHHAKLSETASDILPAETKMKQMLKQAGFIQTSIRTKQKQN